VMVRGMIKPPKHHRPNLKWIIASGLKTANLVRKFSGELMWKQLQPYGVNNYLDGYNQRSKWACSDGIILFQIPHFSGRRVKVEYFKDTRDWLKYELGFSSTYSPTQFPAGKTLLVDLPVGHRDGNQTLRKKCKDGIYQLWESDHGNWGVQKIVGGGFEVILRMQSSEAIAKAKFEELCSEYSLLSEN